MRFPGEVAADTLRAARELRSLAGELADVDLRHPAWLSLVGGTAVLETLARLAPAPVEDDCYAAYLSANGGPRSDTFMARDRRPDGDPAARIARAVLRARTAVAVLERLDGRFPGQPLRRALARDGEWLRRTIVERALAAVITPRGVFLADLATPAVDLARALGAACAGRPWPSLALSPVDTRSRLPLAASVAVDLSPQPGASARHLHRRAWTAGGGPWLGVGETDSLEVVTTCHLAVDGYGHGLIAGEIFRDLDSGVSNVKELIAAAREGLAGADLSPDPAPPLDGALPLGFAGRVIPGANVRFARVAYALGRLLDRATDSNPRTSPTFQIPVAPGGRDDPDRRRRRVLFGLVALHKQGGELESYPAFRERLRTLLEREAAAEGLASRLLAATATAPVPRRLKHMLLSTSGKANRWLPPVEMLAGRAQISLIRYPPEECPPAPLFGLSAPGLSATPRDPFGSFVVTLVHHGAECSVAVSGTGRAGTPGGALGLLDELLDEMARVPAG